MKYSSARPRVIIGAFIIGCMILLIGMLGGVFGMLMLSNTSSSTVMAWRRALGLGDNPTIPTVVTKKLQLEESSQIIDVAKKINPSVVSVVTKSALQSFYGFTVGQSEGSGSGFVVSADGYIVTNKHVVDGQSSLSVVLNDGSEHDATVIATDPFNDIAVIKIDATGLTPVEPGNSDNLQIGQTVIAVGNAFGEYQNTVTTGIISGKDRSVTAGVGLSADEKLTGLLQTDAAINPGNSGGPLLDLEGQVVGMNTAIASTSGSSAGIGFALPVNTFWSAVESAIKTGKIVRPGLGVRYIQINKAMAEANNLTVQYGALVAKGQLSGEDAVVAGSPADKAGIKEGDILLTINDQQITTDQPLASLVAQYKVGDEVTIKLQRDGKERTITAKLEELQ